MLLNGDSQQHLKEIQDNSIDLILTDPPYGISFMGKDWDKALPSVEIWKECFRVLKEGKLAFIMCSPRQDVLSRMIINLEDAGFRTNYTSIYWTFASGFPKAANISKLIDKRNGRNFDISVKDYLNQKRKEKNLLFHDVNEYLGMATNGGGVASALMGDKSQNELPTLEVYTKLKTLLDLDNRFDELIERTEAEREIIGQSNKGAKAIYGQSFDNKTLDITKPATDEAKKMEGAYVGFQPKPAVEIIIVTSKGKTLTWLDDCRIPYQSEKDGYDRPYSDGKGYGIGYGSFIGSSRRKEEKGRFPANLLVSDDVLNDGRNYKVGDIDQTIGREECYSGGWVKGPVYTKKGDSGSYSRYFSLDSWSKTFPFLITPKANKSERNKGCEDLPLKEIPHNNNMKCAKCGLLILSGTSETCKCEIKQEVRQKAQNNHPTVKPLKLMSYLITMGSREGDIVLDPFCGSGTTCIAAEQLQRKWIGIEINPDYIHIAKARLKPYLVQQKLG